MLHGIDPGAAHIAFGIVSVQGDGLIVVSQRLGRIAQIEVACPSVQIGISLLGLLADEDVEVLDGLVELLREEIGHAAAEIEPRVARAQVHRFLQVAERVVVFADAAQRNGAVVIGRRIDRIEVERAVEVALGAGEVAEIVFGDAAEEIGLVHRAVEMRQDVEALDGLGVLPVNERLAAAIVEVVEVVLRKSRPDGGQGEYKKEEALFEHLRKITKKYYFCRSFEMK